MSSEGIREIDAAKKRLAAARAHKSSASEMIESANSLAKRAEDMKESARKMAETAKAMDESAKAMAETAQINKEAARSVLQKTQSEVDAAEAFVEEAEQRWEVIDVDAEDGTPKRNKKGTKRKASPASARMTGNTLQPNNTNVSIGNDVQVGAARNDRSVQAAGVPISSSNDSDEGEGSNVREIVVEGSGVSEVNGTYKKTMDNHGNSCFTRKGRWNNNRTDFVIYHKSNYWYIRSCGGISSTGNILYPIMTFFRTITRSDGSELPPGNGWMASGRGISPAPKLTW